MFTKRNIAKLLLAGLIFAVLGYVYGPKASPVKAAPATFVVTNTSPSGAGSLAQAISDANNNGNPSEQDTITFNIPVAGDLAIQPTSQLTITQSVLIDGYTQGDATANTAIAPSPFNGILRVAINNSQSGPILVTANNVTLQGLTINYGETGNITVNNANNFKLYGSYLNTAQDGATFMNTYTASQSLVITNSANVEIGGSQAAQRNLFGFCSDSCISASGSGTTDLSVKGNYIGLGADGVESLNGIELGGVGIRLYNNVSYADIGGAASGEGNSIEHNMRGALAVEDSNHVTIKGNRVLMNFYSDSHGVAGLDGGIFLGGVSDVVVGSVGSGRNIISGNRLGVLRISNSTATNSASNNIKVEGNYMGVMDDGTTPFPNIMGGFYIDGSTSNVQIISNVIRNNESDPGVTNRFPGIYVYGNASKVSMLQNSIYNNNSVGISDTYAVNNRLNAPGYTQITETGGNTDVTYTINVPAGNYRIEFFRNTAADTDGPGEGETYLGYQNITTDNSGLQQFTHTLGGTGIANMSLTATKIDNSATYGYAQTSEFGTTGTPYVPPVRDLESRLTLTNPQDNRLGHTLHYIVTVVNNGPDSVALSNFDGSTPGQNNLFNLILPPQLSYSSSDGLLACNSLGAGSAGTAVSYLYNHAADSFVSCGFVGSRVLGNGDSVSFDIYADVVQDDSLDFTSYALGGVHTNDPDYSAINSIITGGQELIDELTSAPVNNFSSLQTTLPESDLSTTATLTNPQDVKFSHTLQYQIDLANNGPSVVSISDLTGANSIQHRNLLQAILPAQLTFSGVDNANIECSDQGDASVAASYLYNHTGYHLITCNYIGGDELEIQPNSAFTVTLSAQVNTKNNLNFTSYFLAGEHRQDPDTTTIDSVMTGQELIDQFSATPVNNFISVEATQPPPPNADLVSTLALTNYQDLSLNNTLHYQLTVTNNGPDSVDIGELDGATPGEDNFAHLYLPPQLAYVGQSNSNVDCSDAGAGSAATVPYLSAHTDYSVVTCNYLGGEHMLASGQSVIVSFDATVVDDTNISFKVYALAGDHLGDPQQVTIADLLANSELINDFNEFLNNIAMSYSLNADGQMNLQLTNPDDVSLLKPLKYSYSYKNNGPGVIDLTNFNGTNLNPLEGLLGLIIVPPNLTFVSSENPDVSCMSLAPATLADIPNGSQVFTTHLDHTLLFCAFAPTVHSRFLAPGESLSTNLYFENDGSRSAFNLYAIGAASDWDPDAQLIYAGFTGESDALDFLASHNLTTNFRYASYPVPVVPQSNEGSGSSQVSESGVLSKTGVSQYVYLTVGAPITILSLAMHMVLKKRRKGVA